MSESSTSSLKAVLSQLGWAPQTSGRIGELWGDTDGHQVGVPYNLVPTDHEWPGALRRVADAISISVEDLEQRIQWYGFDVTNFRVNGPQWQHSVPVTAGVNLFKTAHQILRTSATTSRGAKAVIGSNYSQISSDLLARSRFGHTIDGSYIVPLLVPVTDESHEEGSSPQSELRQDDSVFQRAEIETDERRTTRTMAESLRALHDLVVKPDKMPNTNALTELIHSGVSRELVTSLIDVLEPPSVRAFTASFKWSAALRIDVNRIPTSIELPAEATGVLREVAPLFARTKKPRVETFTGPIVQLRHERSVSFGTITLDTTRSGRRAEVIIDLQDELLENAHEWFQHDETVIVQGMIDRDSSQKLRIIKPETVRPLGEHPLSLDK